MVRHRFHAKTEGRRRGRIQRNYADGSVLLLFTLLAFALAVAPPFVVRFLPQPAYGTLVRSPVGIVKGCVHTTTQSDWELACSKDDPFKVQWLFNIGGFARYSRNFRFISPTIRFLSPLVPAASTLRPDSRSRAATGSYAWPNFRPSTTLRAESTVFEADASHTAPCFDGLVDVIMSATQQPAIPSAPAAR
jgi:hypothetical protein